MCGCVDPKALWKAIEARKLAERREREARWRRAAQVSGESYQASGAGVRTDSAPASPPFRA